MLIYKADMIRRPDTFYKATGYTAPYCLAENTKSTKTVDPRSCLYVCTLFSCKWSSCDALCCVIQRKVGHANGIKCKELKGDVLCFKMGKDGTKFIKDSRAFIMSMWE